MLPKETRELMKERDKYALFNYQAYKELQRNITCNPKILSRYFCEAFQKFSVISSKVLIIWADLLTRVGDISKVAVMETQT